MGEKWTLYIDGEKITIQGADYIEDGPYIEIENGIIKLFEIPQYGGNPGIVGVYDSIIEAIEKSKTLT